LAIKRLRISYDGTQPIVCRIAKSGKGPITGADVQCEGGARVANTDLHIASLTKDRKFNAELTVSRGRGYIPADENASESLQLGTIPVDSIYSPVTRVRYLIEQTRVGKLTNYDRLVMEIWTDGTITPDMALTEAAKIYRKHLNPFVISGTSRDLSLIAEDPSTSEFNVRNQASSEVNRQLSMSISELELSVRARNCLDGANIQTVGDLVSLGEEEVMNLKNLGRTSLLEIKNKLAERGLSLGMGA
jgi:DNA-directed RNA polymerase subunit alpha